MLKLLSLFILFFLLGFLGVFGLRYYQLRKISSSQFIPQNIILKPSPPARALSGSVDGLLGHVTIQKRSATAVVALMPDDPFLQGETVATDTDSDIALSFPSFLSFHLFPQSNISLINTLPQSFLISQNQGQVSYSLLGSAPVSVKALHLLTQINSGNVSVKIINQKIALVLTSGSLTLAYEDKNNLTRTSTLVAPHKIIFNDAARTLTTSRR